MPPRFSNSTPPTYRVYSGTGDEWIASNGTDKRVFDSGTPAQNEAAARSYVVAQTTETGAQAWESGIRNIIEEQGRHIVKDVITLSMEAQDNGIADIIKDAEPGKYLPGTTILKEDAASWNNMMSDLMAFLMGQASGEPAGVTRRALILRRTGVEAVD